MVTKERTVATGPLDRRGDMVLLAIILAGAAASLISARLTPFALFAPLLVICLAAIANGHWRNLVPAWGPVTAALVALIALSFASTLWAEAGGKAVGKLLSVMVTAGAAVMGAWVIVFDPIFSGLAWSFVFGVVASTAFTLLVVPIAYALARR